MEHAKRAKKTPEEKEAAKAERKRKSRHPSAQRRLDVLSYYYPIDEERRLIDVTLHYDKASDILATEVGSKERPLVSADFLSKIGTIFDGLPSGYSVDLSLDIADYEGYDPKALMGAFNDALEINHYRSEKGRKRKWLSATIMVLIGIAILFIMGTGSVNGWFGDGENASLISEVLDIAGWVFIWEAVSVLFLSPSETMTLGLMLARRLHELRFYKHGSEEPLEKEDRKALLANWRDDKPAKRAGDWLLLISGSAFFAFGIAYCFNSLMALFTMDLGLDAAQTTWYVVIVVLVSVLYILGGIGGTSRYIGKGPLYRFSGIYAIFLLAVEVSLLIVAIVSGSNVFGGPTGIFSSTVGLIIATAYVVGFFLDRYSK